MAHSPYLCTVDRWAATCLARGSISGTPSDAHGGCTCLRVDACAVWRSRTMTVVYLSRALPERLLSRVSWRRASTTAPPDSSYRSRASSSYSSHSSSSSSSNHDSSQVSCHAGSSWYPPAMLRMSSNLASILRDSSNVRAFASPHAFAAPRK